MLPGGMGQRSDRGEHGGIDGGWGWKEVKHDREGHDEEENGTWKADKRAHMTRRDLTKESQLISKNYML